MQIVDQGLSIRGPKGRNRGAEAENASAVAGKSCAVCLALVATLVAVPAAKARNPQVAGLQVALRAYGLYGGAIDGIPGPQTIQATKAFQRRAGLAPDGRAGPRTRRALGPLGRPLFGRRTMR